MGWMESMFCGSDAVIPLPPDPVINLRKEPNTVLR
jgi:hypothetical protein